MENFSPQKTLFFLSSIALVGGFLGGAVGIFIFSSDDSEEKLGAVVGQNSDAIAELYEVVTLLAEGNETLKEQLVESESARTLALETTLSTQEALESELATLRTSVSEATFATADLSTLIGEWSMRIVRVGCVYGKSTSIGSGTLTSVSGVPTVITNFHVIDNGEGDFADVCAVQLPDGTKVNAPNSAFSVSQDRDLANIRLTESGVHTPTSAPRCVEDAKTGDEVVILGYPSVGSKDSVTATDGIISGRDGDYYVTSAKIERGNSGGAAVHVENNCLLGIPTLTVVGRVESLARILPLN